MYTQVAVFEGRAAGPLPWLSNALRADRFRKLFFLHPDSEELLGRLDVGYGAVGAKLYPTYFRATVGSSIVPGECLPSSLCYTQYVLQHVSQSVYYSGYGAVGTKLYSTYFRATVGSGVVPGVFLVNKATAVRVLSFTHKRVVPGVCLCLLVRRSASLSVTQATAPWALSSNPPSFEPLSAQA